LEESHTVIRTKVSTTIATSMIGVIEIDSSEDAADPCKRLSPSVHDPNTLSVEAPRRLKSVDLISRRERDALRAFRITLLYTIVMMLLKTIILNLKLDADEDSVKRNLVSLE